MANRHKMHRKAGGGRETYTGQGSAVQHEAESKGEEFKKGGRKHHVGRAAGGRATGGKRFARGGRAKSPFSHAAGSLKGSRGFAAPIKGTHGGHGEHVDLKAHGGGTEGGHYRHGHGGKAKHQYAKGGRAKEEEDGGDDGEEDDGCGGMKKGGRAPEGMHYRGGKGKKVVKGHHAVGGAVSGGPGGMARGGRHWMQEAFKGSHGQFKQKAEKAGMSTAAYANREADSAHASTKTKRQANLAKLGERYGGHHG